MPQSHRVHHSLKLAGMVLALTATAAPAEIIPGMPDAIVCSVEDPTGVLPWSRLVFYVSARMRDGATLYKSSTSDPVVLLVDSDGILDAVNLADCDGRSIESLRKGNRAFTFATGAPLQESRPR